MCIPLKQRFVIKTTHNAKYKTKGLAATALAIGKVFVFTIKEPQERLGLFAVARSPSGSLVTKMFRFRHEVRYPGFPSQRKSVEKVADHLASYHAVRCVSTLRIISQPVGGIFSQVERSGFTIIENLSKRIRTIHTVALTVLCITKIIPIFVTQSAFGFHYDLNPSKRLWTIRHRCHAAHCVSTLQILKPSSLAASVSQAERSGFSHQKPVEKGFGQSLLPTVR